MSPVCIRSKLQVVTVTMLHRVIPDELASSHSSSEALPIASSDLSRFHRRSATSCLQPRQFYARKVYRCPSQGASIGKEETSSALERMSITRKLLTGAPVFSVPTSASTNHSRACLGSGSFLLFCLVIEASLQGEDSAQCQTDSQDDDVSG